MLTTNPNLLVLIKKPDLFQMVTKLDLSWCWKKSPTSFNVHKPSSFDATSFSFTKLFLKPSLSNVFIIHSFPFHAQITRSFLLLAFFHDCHLFKHCTWSKNTKKWCETWDFNSFSSFALFFLLLSHLHPMFLIAPRVFSKHKALISREILTYKYL